MKPLKWALLVTALFSSVASPQERLHLKSTAVAEGASTGQRVQRRTEPARRPASAREHLLVQFEDPVTEELVQELQRRGATLVQYVPDSGFVFSVRPGQDWSGLRLRTRRFRPDEKISPLLSSIPEDRHSTVVVEFFPDVQREEASRLIAAEGLAIQPHPDLLPNHFLVRGPRSRIQRLAQLDEVAYLFPASEVLASGSPVLACGGAVTPLGPVGQYVAAVGEGWDGPGQGKAYLGYFFERLTSQLPPEQLKAEILRALNEWARYVEIQFTAVPSSNFSRTLSVLFAKGTHGDSYPFDGPGRTLAHTFYPSPPNPETIAGDIHLDDSEQWAIGESLSPGAVDVFSVVLHEVGHALGLAHSDLPGSVMYPYYRRHTALTDEDIRAIRSLYAARTPPPGSNPTTPSSDPLAITILSPSVFPYTTPAAFVSLSGTVSGGTGQVSVSWSSDRGFSGSASGGRSWSIAEIPLLLGSNLIRISAQDQSGLSASISVLVERTAIVDTAAPVLRITSPATTSVLVTSPTLQISGTASDNVGVAKVTWISSAGKSGSAAGTTQWSAEVPLVIGSNTIVIRAYDLAGNSSWRSVSVTRR